MFFPNRLFGMCPVACLIGFHMSKDIHSLSQQCGIVNVMWCLHQNIEERYFMGKKDWK